MAEGPAMVEAPISSECVIFFGILCQLARRLRLEMRRQSLGHSKTSPAGGIELHGREHLAK